MAMWAAFAVMGAIKPARRWIQRGGGESWPLADGRINSAEISKPNFSLTVKTALISRSLFAPIPSPVLTTSGGSLADIPTEYEAEEFIRDLNVRQIRRSSFTTIRKNRHIRSNVMPCAEDSPGIG
jgi:hypothetical protein